MDATGFFDISLLLYLVPWILGFEQLLPSLYHLVFLDLQEQFKLLKPVGTLVNLLMSSFSVSTFKATIFFSS